MIEIKLGAEKQTFDQAMAACIGYFDGFHLGHQSLFNKTLSIAKRNNQLSAIISFDPDPWVVIHKVPNANHLTTIEDRKRLAAALGFDVCAFVGVQLVSTNQYVGVIDALKLMPEVVECHFITGEFALLLKLFCRDNEHLMDVLVNTIQNIQGISRTETFISLDQAIERPVYVKDKSVVK